ncbi:MAG TPA: biotin/lipoyl-binding protein [Candidatus Limnocylindria bacterium]
MKLRTFVATWPGRLVALLIIAALGGGAATVARANSATPAVAPRTATVARGSITQAVSVSGSVNSSAQTRLAFKTGGKLAQVYVNTGQAVTPGQPLAALDTTDLQNALATANQNLANAQASYQKQVQAASDTQAALVDTQKSTALSIANAQAALSKIQTNYATAKKNLGSLSDGISNDTSQYRSAIDALRAQGQVVTNDISLYSSSDVSSARQSLYSADLSLANAQSYGSITFANDLAAFISARDTLLSATTSFDNAMSAGGDTSAAVSSYQTVLLNYNLAQATLSSAIDTLTGFVSSAQTSANAAATSLNSNNSRFNTNLDQARGDILVLQNLYTTDAQYSLSAKTRSTQTTSQVSTITDAVTGSLVSATNAITSAQQQADTSLRNAQSAVANIPFNLQSASVSVQNAQTAVDTAKANIDAAVLTAPTAGVVASIANQIGEFVSGGNTNSAFIVLTSTNTMVLHGTIGEADISKLKLGQVANVTVDAVATAKMTGRVISLDPVATISQGVPVYGVDVAIDVPADGVKAGMTGTASVILASKQNVLVVPNTAIRTVNGQRGVQVLKGGEIVDTPAQFGVSNDTLTEVVSGLAEGDTIVIPQARAGASTQPNRGGFPGVGGGGGVRIGGGG